MKRVRSAVALVLAGGRSGRRDGDGEQDHSEDATRRARRRRRRILGALLAFTACAALIVSIVGAYVAYEWIRAPGLDDLRPNSADARARATEKRPGAPPPLYIPVAWSEMPVALKNATVAIEDQRFYSHGAIDVKGVVRAALKNAFSGATRQGGSTITQQLARMLYIRDTRRSLARKVRETKIAMQLEDRHSKQWILWKYLNSVPYGAVNGRLVIGAEAAAQAFFSSRAKDLTLAQSALLAGLPQAPGEYNPLTHPDRARGRRADVLAKMVELGLAPKPDAAQAALAPVAVTTCDSSAGGTDLRPVSFTGHDGAVARKRIRCPGHSRDGSEPSCNRQGRSPVPTSTTPPPSSRSFAGGRRNRGSWHRTRSCSRPPPCSTACGHSLPCGPRCSDGARCATEPGAGTCTCAGPAIPRSARSEAAWTSTASSASCTSAA